MTKPGKALLEEIVTRCGIVLDHAQFDQLWRYHRLLRAANPRLNLTRIHRFENMVLKHYVDSLLVLNWVELPSPLIDMGSGAGLPGIPLKIARPGTSMILAEPRAGRVEFLREACAGLGLEGIEVYSHKIGPSYPGKAAGVITRAVASIPETLDRVEEVLDPGGLMLFMKGPGCDAEIAAAAASHAGSWRLKLDQAYEIPGTPHERRLVVYERLDSSKQAGTATSTAALRWPIREVTSDSNPTFRLCRDLLSGRGIRKHGQALISGTRLVDEMLQRFADRALAWVSTAKGPGPAERLPDGRAWIRLADPLFRELDTAGTHAPLLLVSVPNMPRWSDDDPWPAGCTLFVPFQDPENVGAVIRSAAAFGVARVVLLREAAHPFHPKAVRAAGPALFQVELRQGPSLRQVSSVHAPLVVLATAGDELDATPFPQRFGLVAGIEGPGLPEALRRGPCRRIPIARDVESLNAAAATAIALYAWRCGHKRSAE